MKALFVLVTVLLTGCIAPPANSVVLVKRTVFGLDVSREGHMRVGLVRDTYQQIPTSAAPLYAPSVASQVDADLGLAHQTAHESIRVNAPETKATP